MWACATYQVIQVYIMSFSYSEAPSKQNQKPTKKTKMRAGGMSQRVKVLATNAGGLG